MTEGTHRSAAGTWRRGCGEPTGKEIHTEATSMMEDVGAVDGVDEDMVEVCVGASESIARITHVDALLSVVTRKWQILRWSSNSSVQEKSSFHVRPLFFQRQVTVAVVVTERVGVWTEFLCRVMAFRSQCVARRSKYDRTALRP